MAVPVSGAVVLLSGGQDSTTCLAWAAARHDSGLWETVIALSIDYGQRHQRELDAASAIAMRFGVQHYVVSLGLGTAIPSALTTPGIGVRLSGGINDLPTTYVPGRNAVFLALAAGVAQAHDLERVVIGCSGVDYSGYPDCRPAFISAQEKALRLALDMGRLRIHAPLVDMTKRETVELARTLGPDCWKALALSWTCYLGAAQPCLECPACELRARGFNEAGFPDPALEG